LNSQFSEYPHFSVVIPTFNRRSEVKRALGSVLNQDFDDYEVILVDDASTDGTVDAVMAMGSPRIRVVSHSENRGVCPARNSGVAAAVGDWILFLDSDDELLPGGLRCIDRYTRVAPSNIARFGFMYRQDDGSLSPDPAPRGEILNYEKYISWTTIFHTGDFFNCIRRRTFNSIQFEDNRSYETLYHLEFAKQFLTLLIPEVVAFIHRDALNRVSNLSRADLIERLRRDAPDNALATGTIIARHGEALMRLAPNRYKMLVRNRFLFDFLAARRWDGFLHAVNYLRRYPNSVSGWGILALGMLGSSPLAWIKSSRR
jgi:glycosyltransferase involved in cell wall biosynthesis